MSSLFNPGKRGILTLLSVVLIIGIPALVAYADSSNDTYYSEQDLPVFDYFSIQNSNAWYNFSVTTVEGDDSDIAVIADTSIDEATSFSSLTSVTGVNMIIRNGTFEVAPSKIVFDSSLEETAVIGYLKDSSSTLLSFTMVYNDESQLWEYEVDSVDALAASGATSLSFTVYKAAGAIDSEIEVTHAVYAKETIFTDDIVELIVLVGGIALLIIGTFSLSFIDLDTPGKAANSFIRGAKSAGRKVSSYAKGRGKK